MATRKTRRNTAGGVVEEEFPGARAIALETAMAGKARDGVIFDHEQGRIIVRLKYASSDLRHRLGVAYGMIEQDGQYRLTPASGIEVTLEPLPITDVHQQAKEEPLHWLRSAIVDAGEDAPMGTNRLALAAYYSRLIQHERFNRKDGEAEEGGAAVTEKLKLRLAWTRRLAQIPRLSDDEYLLLACETLPPSRQALRMTKQLQARGERAEMTSETPAVQEELEAKQQAKQAAKTKAKQTPAGAAPVETSTNEEKAMKTSAAVKTSHGKPASKKRNLKLVKGAKGKKAGAPKAKRAKVDLIGMKKHFKAGMKVKYVGKNKEFFNKTVEVLYPEKDPAVGVMIKFPGDKRQSVSPTSLSK